MLLWRRPPEPADFAERARAPRQRIEAAIEAGEAPSFEPPLWQSYKATLSAAQEGKCAYCEESTLAGSVGQVDHFRPKGAVTVLEGDPETWGREVKGASNVVGRRLRPCFDRGYWWLAYDWENFRFSCERCNTVWKKTLFPVAGPSRRLPPAPDAEETGLLLDPYEDEPPSRHLRFDELGQIQAEPDSARGFETVRTLGLDRESLRQFREEKASKAFQLLRFLDGHPGERDRNEALDDLIRLGHRRFVHAGMVRIIAERWLGVSWADLVAFRAELG